MAKRERVPLSTWDGSLLGSGESVPDVPWEEFFRAGSVNGYNPATGVPYRTIGQFLKDPLTLPHDRWMTTQLEEGAEPMFWTGLTLTVMIWSPLTLLAKATHSSFLTPVLVTAILTGPLWLYFVRGRRTEKRGEVGGSVLWLSKDVDDGAFGVAVGKALAAQFVPFSWKRVVAGGGWAARVKPATRISFGRGPDHTWCILTVRTIGAANAAQHRRMKGLLLDTLGLAQGPA